MERESNDGNERVTCCDCGSGLRGRLASSAFLPNATSPHRNRANRVTVQTVQTVQPCRDAKRERNAERDYWTALRRLVEIGHGSPIARRGCRAPDGTVVPSWMTAQRPTRQQTTDTDPRDAGASQHRPTRILVDRVADDDSTRCHDLNDEAKGGRSCTILHSEPRR